MTHLQFLRTAVWCTCRCTCVLNCLCCCIEENTLPQKGNKLICWGVGVSGGEKKQRFSHQNNRGHCEECCEIGILKIWPTTRRSHTVFTVKIVPHPSLMTRQFSLRARLLLLQRLKSMRSFRTNSSAMTASTDASCTTCGLYDVR